MATHLNNTLTIARREWLQFLRSRHFLILGVISPLALAAILWTLIFFNSPTTADGTDRWQFFQGELKRFGDDIKGTYNFEKSEERILFYVVDHTDLNLLSALQHELLRRDITNLLAYLNATPYEHWQWFGSLEEEVGTGPRELWSAVSKENITAEELISNYSLEHDTTFSSRLATTDENFSWFVEEWNDNIDEIAQSISQMSFNRAVLVINTQDDWVKSAWAPAYIEIPEDFLETRQGNYFAADSSISVNPFKPEFRQVRLLHTWFEELIERASKVVFQDSGNTDDDHAIGESKFVSLDRKTNDSLNDIARKHERTRHLSSFTFTSLFLLFTGYAWFLLQFDPSFKPKNEFSVIESSTTVMDGRALGTMQKIVSIAGIWLVLLLVPEFLLVGTNPLFGVGALAVIFNPINLLNYFLFVLLGLWTICYILDALKLFGQTGRSLVLLLVLVGFAILWNSSGPGSIPGSIVGVVFLFFPLIGPTAMVNESFGYPDILTYSIIVFVAVIFLIGFRFFIKQELKLQARKKLLKYRLSSKR